MGSTKEIESITVFAPRPHLPPAALSQWLSLAGILRQTLFWEIWNSFDGLLWFEDAPKSLTTFLRWHGGLVSFQSTLLPPLSHIRINGVSQFSQPLPNTSPIPPSSVPAPTLFPLTDISLNTVLVPLIPSGILLLRKPRLIKASKFA